MIYIFSIAPIQGFKTKNKDLVHSVIKKNVIPRKKFDAEAICKITKQIIFACHVIHLGKYQLPKDVRGIKRVNP